MQLGLYTFIETAQDAKTGAAVDPARRIANFLEEVTLADQVGLDVYAVGEHHRPDFLASAPAVLLAAAAARTKNIRLSSAVTVLSSEDPVRVFQQFATLDLISQGRAEIMAGRGSFIESFPLFGQDLNDYDALFAEKLHMLMEIRDSEKLTWSGEFRPPVDNLGIYPRPLQNPLPIWIAVGGTPQSVARAGALGLPFALAIIGGMPERFAHLAALYRQAGARTGQDPASLKVGINVHGFIADTSQEAADLAFPPFSATMSRIGRERGWPPTTRADFDASLQPRGNLLVGSPQQIIDKILFHHELFANDRYLIQMSVGPMPHDKMMRSIELFGTKVAPVVRKAVAASKAGTALSA